MQNMPDYSEILRFLQTQEGKQLIAALRRADPAKVNLAADCVKKGDYTGAKQLLSDLLREHTENSGSNHSGR